MGKVSKWFRGLLGLKKTDYSASPAKPLKEKRRWSLVRPSYTEKYNTTDATCTPYRDNNNHAMAVAAATAAVAEAAVAAAEAAAVVVRLTSSSCRCADAGATRIRQHWAAVKIQAAFRGCLARRALRALKGLVKLQALARGQIERKRTAEWLKRVQALLHAQAEASAGLTLHASPSTAKLSTHLHLSGPETPEKFESPIRSKSMKFEQSPIFKRNGSKSCVLVNGYQEICGSRSESQVNEQSCNSGISLIRTYSSNDERNDRVIETESGKPHFSLKRRNLSYSTGCDHYSKSLNSTKESTSSLQSGQSPSCEIQSYSYSSQKVNEVEESPFCTADNSPQFLSAASKDDGFKRSPFTPTRSDGSRSSLRGYPDYPSYMACTESSKAKVRSLSAPKQRPQSERSGSSNRYSLHGFDMSRLATQRAMHASFTNKAYPGSGRLDKLGMPVGYRY